jgi:hypothetical protein
MKMSGQFIINPKDYKTDRFYAGCLIFFWIIWAPITAIVTYMAVSGINPLLYIWLIFGYLGTILIPLNLLNKGRKQVLEATGDLLLVHGAGVLPTSVTRIDRQNLLALTLEHYDEESVHSLNLFHKRGKRSKRIMLAPFVHPKDKGTLFERIEIFLREQDFIFEAKNEMEVDKNAELD